MEFNSGKRRRDSSSQSIFQLDSTSKRTMRKLDFSSSPVVHIDENSCGSAFSDHSTDESLSNDDTSLLNDHFSDVFKSSPSPTLDSPVLTIRRRSNQLGVGMAAARKLLKEKSKSDSFFEASHETIKKAVEVSIQHATANHHDGSDRLVGDLSRPHTLPILGMSKHRDLASISAHTLVDLMNGKYAQEIVEFSILDARYPYEFAGGHITGAESAYVKDELFEKLFKNAQLSDKPRVLIIHCEFSSERGPKL